MIGTEFNTDNFVCPLLVIVVWYRRSFFALCQTSICQTNTMSITKERNLCGCQPPGVDIKHTPFLQMVIGSCLYHAASCHRAGRALSSSCLVPEVRPKARQTTRSRSCLILDRPVADLYFLFFKKLAGYISYQATQDGWMDQQAYISFSYN